MLTESEITWDALEALIADDERGVVASQEACDALGEEIVRCEVLQGGGLYRQLLCLRLFERGNGWEGWRTLESWMGVKLGLPYKTANERLRVARSLAQLPRIDEAFREGRLSYTKVRALHDVATPENEETLLEQARWASGEQLRRLLAPLRGAKKRSESSQAAREEERRISFLEHPTEDLVEVRVTLLPEEAAVFRKALEVAMELQFKKPLSSAAADSEAGVGTDSAASESEAGSGEAGSGEAGSGEAGSGTDSAAADMPGQRFRLVDALVFVAESFLARPPRAGVPAGRRELLIHTYPDPDSSDSDIGSDLGSGLLETGDSLSAETVQRLACDGATVVVKRGADGEVLDVGRRTRRVNRALGRALEVRDPCCRFPGCARRAMLDAHHVRAWSEGGKTNLRNLVRLCRTHHRYVHEGGWAVQRTSEGEIEFVDPRGRRVEVGRLPELSAREAHGALSEESKARRLQVESDQLTALGGGAPIDYAYATSVLADCCGFELDRGGRAG